MLRKLSTFMAVALLLLPDATAAEQSSAGSLTGIIRDSSGAEVPGTIVQVVNETTGTKTETVSDSAGAFSLATLTPGRYRLEATLDGFEPGVRQLMVASGQSSDVTVILEPGRLSEGVVVTARRVEEAAQDVPIPLSVINGDRIEEAGNFNVNRLQQTVPTIQFYTTNPRNSFLNIRGLGLPFGLANDGIEPGVGMYAGQGLLRDAHRRRRQHRHLRRLPGRSPNVRRHAAHLARGD